MSAPGSILVANPSVTAADDEQERIGLAVTSSSLRMLQAGFRAVGPGTRDSGFVSECLAGADSPGRLTPLPGEVARDVSDVYVYQPDSGGAPEVGELLTVAVFAVEEADALALGWFVMLLGHEETAVCRRDELLAAVENDPSSARARIETQATTGLAVGDASSRLDVRIVFSREGASQPVTHTFLVSRVGHTLVLLRSARFGAGPFSGFDPQVELAAIASELDPP